MNGELKKMTIEAYTEADYSGSPGADLHGDVQSEYL